MIKKTLGHKLLNENYCYQKMNIALEPICYLMGKIVIMSNDNFEGTKLNEMINCSLLNNFIKKDYERDLFSKTKPFIGKQIIPTNKISTTLVSFKKGFTNDLITINDPMIDLFDLGIKKNYSVRVSGAKFGKNNIEKPALIYSLTKNTIVLTPVTNFEDESSGNEILLSFYSDELAKKMDKLGGSSITDYNKTNLSIVVPNDNISSVNYDSYNFFILGIQFVTMNYQTDDYNMIQYNNKFKHKSIILKPSNLRINRSRAPTPSLRSQVPEPIKNLKIDIDYDFFSDVMNKEDDTVGKIYLTQFSNANMRLINHKNKGVAKLSIKYDGTNSIFNVRSPGLNGKPNSISISIGYSFLTHRDSCCYLIFQDRPSLNTLERTKHNDDASFYPVISSCGKKGYYSLISTKDELYMNRMGEHYRGANYKMNHIIKYRSNFKFKQRLYKKTTKYFNKIHTFVSGKGQIDIWRADPIENFYPLGDMLTFTPSNESTVVPIFTTYLVNGATENPINYELIWNNKGSYNSKKCSIWKPIAPDGFISLGYIVHNSYTMPSVDLVRCVATDFVDEIKLGDKYGFNGTFEKDGRQIGWENTGETDKDPLSFWQISNSANLLLAASSFYKPSEFDTPVYNLISEDVEKDYKDRLYMDRVKYDPDSKMSGCFKIHKTVKEEISPVLKNIIDKAINRINTKREKGIEKIRSGNLSSDQCITKNEALWAVDKSGYLRVDTCKIDKGNGDGEGSNWILYPDKTIRYSKNNSLCMTVPINKYGPVVSPHGMTPDEIIEWRTTTNTNGECGNSTSRINDGELPDNSANVMNIKPCDINLSGQKFEFTDVNKNADYLRGRIKYVGDNSGFQDTCLTHTDDGIATSNLRLQNCILKNQDISKQQWNIFNKGPEGCLSIGNYVYVLQKIPRDTDNKSEVQTDIIKLNGDPMDENNFNLYISGRITGEIEKTDFWEVTLDTNSKKVEIRKNSLDIILNKIPKDKDIKPGTDVICTNGKLLTYDYNEEFIMWRGVVIKKENDNKYLVLFSINSIETDKLRQSYSRQSYLDIKSIRISDIRVLKKYTTCID